MTVIPLLEPFSDLKMKTSSLLSNLKIEIITCFLQSPDSLHLAEDGGEGVGDDGEHDNDGDEEDEGGGEDHLDVPPCHLSSGGTQRSFTVQTHSVSICSVHIGRALK